MSIASGDWVKGGLPKTSHVDTETLLTLKHNWIGDYCGRIDRDVLQRARKKIKEYLT